MKCFVCALVSDAATSIAHEDITIRKPDRAVSEALGDGKFHLHSGIIEFVIIELSQRARDSHSCEVLIRPSVGKCGDDVGGAEDAARVNESKGIGVVCRKEVKARKALSGNAMPKGGT